MPAVTRAPGPGVAPVHTKTSSEAVTPWPSSTDTVCQPARPGSEFRRLSLSHFPFNGHLLSCSERFECGQCDDVGTQRFPPTPEAVNVAARDAWTSPG